MREDEPTLETTEEELSLVEEELAKPVKERRPITGDRQLDSKIYAALGKRKALTLSAAEVVWVASGAFRLQEAVQAWISAFRITSAEIAGRLDRIVPVDYPEAEEAAEVDSSSEEGSSDE